MLLKHQSCRLFIFWSCGSICIWKYRPWKHVLFSVILFFYLIFYKLSSLLCFYKMEPRNVMFYLKSVDPIHKMMEVALLATNYWGSCTCSSRIFLLGPSHHYYTPKCALSRATVYKTPIGDLPIDLEGTLNAFIRNLGLINLYLSISG